MLYSWLSVLPPLIVVICAAISHRLNTALLCGIVAAALIATHAAPIDTVTLLGTRFWSQIIDLDKAYLYIFLISIGTLIALFNYTGCARAFATLIATKIRSARAAQGSAIAISFLLFIDDYLSILTNGYVMCNLADRFGIARVKLAFLVHSLAGSVVILAPVSSWVAAITTYLGQAGVSPTSEQGTIVLADPFYLYLKSVPFIFYSFLIIASVIYIVRRNISFGPMRQYEQEAAAKAIAMPHEASSFAKAMTDRMADKPKDREWAFLDLILPLATLFLTVLIGIPIAGGFPHLPFMEAVKQNNQTFLIMCIGGLLGLLVGILMAHYRRTVKVLHYPALVREGFDSIQSTIVMIFLAAVLGIMMREDLHAGEFLASTLLATASLAILPVLIFLTSLITALAIGSAWGTMALLIPLAIPMVATLSQLPIPAHPDALMLLAPVLGALFSGAVCGNHISPLADITIMSALSTGVTPLQHFYTQLPYAIPATIACAFGFILIGLLMGLPLGLNGVISLGVSMILCLGMLEVMNRIGKK